MKISVMKIVHALQNHNYLWLPIKTNKILYHNILYQYIFRDQNILIINNLFKIFIELEYQVMTDNSSYLVVYAGFVYANN